MNGRGPVGYRRGGQSQERGRLVSQPVVIEAHDEWQVTRRYLSAISMAELRTVIADKQSAAKPLAKQRQIA